MISRPVVVSPVKATFATRSLLASGLPASTPKPLTMLSTPSGSRSPTSCANSRIDTGVCSAGLSTTQLPAASAGASFQVAISSGKFHGMICATTPERLVEVVGDGVARRARRPSPPGRGSRRRSSGSGPRPAAGRRPGTRGPACRCPRSRRPRGCSRLASIRSAILFRMIGTARSALVLPQASLAACAASRASSMSSAVERATSQNGLPVTGRDVLEVLPLHRRHPLAADEVVVASVERDESSRGFRGWHKPSDMTSVTWWPARARAFPPTVGTSGW